MMELTTLDAAFGGLTAALGVAAMIAGIVTIIYSRKRP